MQNESTSSNINNGVNAAVPANPTPVLNPATAAFNSTAGANATPAPQVSVQPAVPQPVAQAEPASVPPAQTTTINTPDAAQNVKVNSLSNIKGMSTGVLRSAKHGVGYVLGAFNKDINVYESDRLTGDELATEVEKVKVQSAEYRKKSDIIEDQRIQDFSEKKVTSYKYTVKDSSGKLIKSTFDAPGINDVKIFLTNEGYEIIEIKERGKYDFDINLGDYKVKGGDLAFMLTQLATYIKAGIPLIQSVRILAKQTENQRLKKVMNKVVYELIYGEKFSSALAKQGNSFPRLLINMVKTSEMTGDLAGTLEEMADYYTEAEKARKAMMSAMIYPAVIFSFALIAVVFIIMFVVPQFIDMFQSNDAELPAITKFIIFASAFLGSYWWALILGLVAIVVTYRWLYKNVKEFRKTMQTIYMKMPVIGNVIIFNEVTTLARTFSSLLKHNVFITDSMEILSKISDNEIYKEIIDRTLISLSKGAKISETFRGEWAFPVVAYEMLVTGESTGQLALMMEKVAEHFQNLHHNAVTTIKSLIEPIVIVFLAGAVGFIIMSIILPMFDLYGQL